MYWRSNDITVSPHAHHSSACWWFSARANKREVTEWATNLLLEYTQEGLFLQVWYGVALVTQSVTPQPETCLDPL